MKNFQDLNLSNAFLFAATMQDLDAFRLVLEMILGHPVGQVNVHAEHTVLFSSDYRSIRLDVYGNDALDVQYNVEAQNKNEKNLPKRSRYHQAEMDVSSLKPGEDFNSLKPSYVIFICTFDPFGDGLYRYTFEPRCLETGKPLGDETCRIFLSTKGKNEKDVPQELVQFLHYMENSTDSYVESKDTEASIKKLHEKVKQIKKNADLEGKYMTGAELLRISAEEGKVEGKAEGKAEAIIELLESKGMVSEELRAKIQSETRIGVLDAWFTLAIKVSTVEEFAIHISAE